MTETKLSSERARFFSRRFLPRQGENVEVRQQWSNPDTVSHPILLYDGVCGLCNRFVQLILRRDQATFRFASLQSVFAASILARHSANPADLDTVYLVLNHNESGEKLFPRSDAILFVLHHFGGFWRLTARVLALVPRSARDWAYSVVARHRYRVFGRYDTCRLPTEATRSRFLDL